MIPVHRPSPAPASEPPLDGRMPVRPFPAGYTLIELMVTLTLIGLLAAIAYPPLLRHVDRARQAEGRSALLTLMLQQENRRAGTGTYTAIGPEGHPGFLRYAGGNGPRHARYRLEARACPRQGSEPTETDALATASIQDSAAWPLNACIELVAHPLPDGARHPRLTLDSLGRTACSDANGGGSPCTP
ncbi:prepilin-type N-terminal cleavage/methylation domain-containing protein [Comamonadaceae bacterium PP-2]